MVHILERKIGNNVYIYFQKSFRLGKKIIKTSMYVGSKRELTREHIQNELKKFMLTIDSRLLSAVVRNARNTYKKPEYPITFDDIKKIEMMNLQYHQIKACLNKNDWTDAKKRFIANFVFESNALEGNSLTLKNFREIVFESRMVGSADLREIYDAKNSYGVFSSLFTARKELTESFIIDIHKGIMKNIDDRTGYKRVPNIILGRNLKLTPPEVVDREMKNLLEWYSANENTLHPLELAFKFHHAFERIHPFADGNGRVGRMLLNYILIRHSYYPVIIRATQRNSYLRALEAADGRHYGPLMRFAFEKAKETYRKFFEVYYPSLTVSQLFHWKTAFDRSQGFCFFSPRNQVIA